MAYELLHGDCIAVMEKMEDNSIDAIVTDPPYGLGFMGKAWDALPPGIEVMKEAYRILKPGGHILAFGGSRTYHRLACAVEDAGFEIRDQIMWVYGSGFPKSHNISKAIDKAAGAERKVVGRVNSTGIGSIALENVKQGAQRRTKNSIDDYAGWDITKPTTPEAQQWDGWGTALKPAHEPIAVARKPLIGTVVENVLEHNTGGLNIDGCRVGEEGGTSRGSQAEYPKHPDGTEDRSQNWARTGHEIVELNKGRFPTNLIHDGSTEVIRLFPDSAHFFYCAKSSQHERNKGLEGLEARENSHSTYGIHSDAGLEWNGRNPENRTREQQNFHPTVKPVNLMKWLCRLITPPGGVVLDPFMGSGTTGIAANLEGFNFIGIEKEEDYLNIARHRISHWVEEKEERIREERKQSSLMDW